MKKNRNSLLLFIFIFSWAAAAKKELRPSLFFPEEIYLLILKKDVDLSKLLNFRLTNPFLKKIAHRAEPEFFGLIEELKNCQNILNVKVKNILNDDKVLFFFIFNTLNKFDFTFKNHPIQNNELHVCFQKKIEQMLKNFVSNKNLPKWNNKDDLEVSLRESLDVCSHTDFGPQLQKWHKKMLEKQENLIDDLIDKQEMLLKPVAQDLAKWYLAPFLIAVVMPDFNYELLANAYKEFKRKILRNHPSSIQYIRFKSKEVYLLRYAPYTADFAQLIAVLPWMVTDKHSEYLDTAYGLENRNTPIYLELILEYITEVENYPASLPPLIEFLDLEKEKIEPAILFIFNRFYQLIGLILKDAKSSFFNEASIKCCNNSKCEKKPNFQLFSTLILMTYFELNKKIVKRINNQQAKLNTPTMTSTEKGVFEDNEKEARLLLVDTLECLKAIQASDGFQIPIEHEIKSIEKELEHMDIEMEKKLTYLTREKGQ